MNRKLHFIQEMLDDTGKTLKPVFHFKRTVPKRIKNVFKFQNFVNVDWLVLPQYAKKLTCDELFILIILNLFY